VIGWIIKVIWLSVFAYAYGYRADRLFSEGIEASIFVALMGVIAMMSTGLVIGRMHRPHDRAFILLYIAVEIISVPGAFVTGGLLGFYYWIFPMTQVVRAILDHLGIFAFVASMWASALITVISILIGGGFFKSVQRMDSHAAKPSSA
jgi:hypothetical protein